ncbi:MAG: hypothetical protein ACXWQO_08190 [Bdellovibrionota bacterium]
MKTTKRFILAVLAGALLGGVVLAWLSPSVLLWYFSPPADLAITCKPAVQWAMVTYRKVILTGILLGAIVSAILFLAVNSRRKHKAAPVEGTSPH